MLYTPFTLSLCPRSADEGSPKVCPQISMQGTMGRLPCRCCHTPRQSCYRGGGKIRGICSLNGSGRRAELFPFRNHTSHIPCFSFVFCQASAQEFDMHHTKFSKPLWPSHALPCNNTRFVLERAFLIYRDIVHPIRHYQLSFGLVCSDGSICPFIYCKLSIAFFSHG